MQHLLFAVTLAAALGAGLMAGLFFAFSVFIMRALGRLPPANGIAAMQSINAAILTPLFLTVFFGTAAVSLLLAIVALAGWPTPDSVFLLAGGVLYLAGCIVVTMAFNVPLNNRLAAADPESDAGAEEWRRYLSVWVAWNHVRTVACLAAAACFILALP